jgi:hypothetical protein
VATPSAIASLRINATECKNTGNVGGFDGTNGVTTASYTCIKTDQVVPDLGVSDVEPALFKGINAPAGFPLAGLTSTQLAGLTVTPTFQTIMGVAVSNALYTALQAAQNTTGRPSISRTFAGAAVRGELADPQNGLGWQALGVANPTQQVNVCRRVNGSGTQAAANLLFNQFPCVAPANNPPATNAVSDPARGNALSNTASHWTDGNLYVNEGSGAGNVISCLEKANDFGAYAIGHLSLENPETAKLAALLNAWYTTFGTTPTTPAQAITKATGARDIHSTLFDALDDIAGQANKLNVRILGRWLEQHSGQLCTCLRLVLANKTNGKKHWSVQRTVERAARDTVTTEVARFRSLMKLLLQVRYLTWNRKFFKIFLMKNWVGVSVKVLANFVKLVRG